MKKFLFTLAALLMAGTAFAENYLYIDDIELTKEFVEQSSAKARQIDVAVKAHFDQWTNAWDVTFDFGEIICRGTVADDEGNIIAPDMTLQGMNKNGVMVNIPVALNANDAADHFIAANAVAGYYYPEGSDPDEDDPVQYGAVKWAPGEYECMFMLTLRFPQYFEGGDITIATTCASGADSRPGVETAPKNVTDTYVAHVTVLGGEPEVTEKPVITWEANDETQEVVITVTGAGELVLYNDDVEVARGESPLTYTVPYTDDPEGEEMGFSATAQEEGKEVSEYALATVEVPGKTPVVPEVTEAPVITYDEDTFTVTATGAGTVKLYVNGEEVANPYTFELGEEETTYTVTATAQEEGKEISETATLEVTVPAAPVVIEVTPKPIIEVLTDMESETVTVRATGYGHICIYWDDMLQAEGEGVAEWVIPFGEDPEGEEYGVSATAQEEGKEVSEYALETVFVPGKAEPQPYETPAPEIATELTEDAFVITATGEGNVTVYVQYIDNETGEMTTETYDGEGTVTVTIPRGEEDAYINYWAVAQANEEAVPGTTQVEYFVEVPAKEGGVEPPVDPHAEGVWIVSYDVNGEEVWQELNMDNGDYTGIVRFGYGIYGTFDYYGGGTRPNVEYIFVVNGVRYGAAEDGTLTVLGDAMQNPLYENENHYVLEEGVGKVYQMGIAIDEFTGDMYVYAAVAGFTELDEMNADKAVAGVRYFNMAGQEMQEANGVTIVVTTYTDGTTSAVKVIK